MKEIICMKNNHVNKLNSMKETNILNPNLGGLFSGSF